MPRRVNVPAALAPKAPAARAAEAVAAVVATVAVRGRLAAVVAALILVPCVLGGAAGAAGLAEAGGPRGAQHSVADVFVHNGTVAAIVASGALTMGVGTVLALAPGSFLVGAQLGAAATDLGVWTTTRGVAPHLLPEVAAFAAAGVIGLLPLDEALRVLGGDRSPAGQRVRRVLTHAGALGVLAALLLAVAAALEVSVSAALVAGGAVTGFGAP